MISAPTASWEDGESEAHPSGEWSRLFVGQPDQAERAQAFVDAVSAGRPWRETACLVVAELAANAIQHTRSGEPGGWFVVRVSVFTDRVRLSVFDQGHLLNRPTLMESISDSRRGRGLRLVAALAKDWGVEGGVTGFVVWAVVSGTRTHGSLHL